MLKYLILLFTTTKLFAGILIQDDSLYLSNNERERLSLQIQKAQNFYNSILDNSEDITILINPQSCLRTGYDYEGHRLRFCDNKKTIKAGTRSEDIINHEVFHYLYCGQFPHFCKGELMKKENHVGLLEGIADYFSYLLNPDSYFGENFYHEFNYLRAYQNKLCFNLVPSHHLKGNALTGSLLRLNFNQSRLRDFLTTLDVKKLNEDSCYKEISKPLFIALDRKQATRYWINSDDKLEFQSSLSNQVNIHPISNSKLFNISISRNRITFKPKSNAKGFEKIEVHLKDESDTIGIARFYIGIKK